MTLKERIQFWCDKELIKAHLEWFWAGIKLGFLEGISFAINLWMFTIYAGSIILGTMVAFIGLTMIGHESILDIVCIILSGFVLSGVGSWFMYELIKIWFTIDNDEEGFNEH